jgi:hypothetical protein
VIIDKDNTTIIEGAGKANEIEGRIRQLGMQVEDASSDYVFVIPAPDRPPKGQLLQEVVRTPLLTESRMAVVQFWRGRLQWDRFESTLHMQDVQLGPSGFGVCLRSMIRRVLRVRLA